MARRKKHEVVSDFIVLYHQLPRPLEWGGIFPREGPLEVEIGFGLGDYLLRRAQEFPERNFIGIEIEPICIYRTLHKIASLNRTLGPRAKIDNVRILRAAAEVAFERFFRPASLNNVLSLFPCPWPKKRHIKHRTFSKDFLRLVNSRLVPGGELKIVTDYAPYCEWITQQSSKTGFTVGVKRVNAKYRTKYERKWQAGGQKRFYEILFTKTKHIPVALKEDALVKEYMIPKMEPRQFRFKDTTGPTAIVLKDYIFDAKKKKGMVHLVVSEKSLSQHVWVMISCRAQGYKVGLAAGHAVLPTEAVARAVEAVAKAARRSARQIKALPKKRR